MRGVDYDNVNAGINTRARTRAPTWLVKLDWNLSQDHLLELTSFSDTARTTQTVHTNTEGALDRTGVLGTVLEWADAYAPSPDSPDAGNTA